MVEVMDVTLRDGEQMNDVSYTPDEKLSTAQVVLAEVQIDRDRDSQRTSERRRARGGKGDLAVESLTRVRRASENLRLHDDEASAPCIDDLGGTVMNVLAKGFLKHLNTRLRKTTEQHLQDIDETVCQAERFSVAINLLVEDWSNDTTNSGTYVPEFINGLATANTLAAATR